MSEFETSNNLEDLPLLSKKEVYELIGRFQNEGSIDARNKVIKHNMRMVYKLARQVYKNYSVKSLELDDLVAEGVTGLVRAIEKFDLSLNYAFSTYAYFWVQETIQRATMKHDHLIKIPVHAHEAAYKYSREGENKKLSDQSLMVQRAYSIKNKINSVDDEDIHDQLVCAARTADQAFEMEQTSSKLESLLSQLKPNQQILIRYRYGLGGYDKMTLDEVASKIDLTRERARQIEGDALKKLAQLISEQNLEFETSLKAS